MNHEQNDYLDIDPATILIGIGYATSLLVAIGWGASCVA